MGTIINIYDSEYKSKSSKSKKKKKKKRKSAIERDWDYSKAGKEMAGDDYSKAGKRMMNG